MLKSLPSNVVFGLITSISLSVGGLQAWAQTSIPQDVASTEREQFLKFRQLCPYIEQLVDLNSPSLALRTPLRDRSEDVRAFFNSTQGSWHPTWMSEGALQRLNLLNTYGTKNRRPEDARPPYPLIEAKIKYSKPNKTTPLIQSFTVEIKNRSFKTLYYGTGKTVLWSLPLVPDRENFWGTGYVGEDSRGELRVVDSSKNHLTLLWRGSGSSNTGGEHPASFYYDEVKTLISLEREADDLIKIRETNCSFGRDQFRSGSTRARFSYSLESAFQITLQKAKK